MTEVSAGIRFPHARLALQITRRRRSLTGRRWRSETVYAITDLDQSQIRPDEIADILRGHWHIENRLHWVRDMTSSHGHPAQPRDQHPPPSRRNQHRRRNPTHLPTPEPSAAATAISQDHHDSDNGQIKNAEALHRMSRSTSGSSRSASRILTVSG